MRAHNQIHAKEEMKTMKKYTTIIMVNKEKTNFNKITLSENESKKQRSDLRYSAFICIDL